VQCSDFGSCHHLTGLDAHRAGLAGQQLAKGIGHAVELRHCLTVVHGAPTADQRDIAAVAQYIGPAHLDRPGEALVDSQRLGPPTYLHDDLETIRLAESLIVAPPIELWPQVVARVPVPGDVEQELLRPLQGEKS